VGEDTILIYEDAVQQVSGLTPVLQREEVEIRERKYNYKIKILTAARENTHSCCCSTWMSGCWRKIRATIAIVYEEVSG
jgi:hypothetical protein